MGDKRDYKPYEQSLNPTTSFRMRRKDLDAFGSIASRLKITKSKLIKKLIKEYLHNPDKFNF